MNNWNFTGNLGKNAELKTTQSGKNVCTFSVAVTSGYGDNQKTTWANCAIFGKRAEGKLPQYLVQGQKVAISGEVQLDEWEKDGVKKSALKVFVNSLDLVGEKKAEAQPQQQQPPINNSQPAPQRTSGFDDFDQDIPFANPYKNIEHLV